MFKFNTLDEIVEFASLDQDQFDYLVANVLKAWDTGASNLIRTVQAPMSAGKTYTLGRATIPSLIQANPSANVFMYSSPRGDITKVFYQDTDDYLGFKDITCVDGTVKQVVIKDGAGMSDLLDDLEKAKRRGKTAQQYLGNTVVVMSVTIQWFDKHNKRLKKLLDIDFAFFDEAHIGLQIGELTTGKPNPDSGRYLPADYDPSWKPLAEGLANSGTKVLAISATLSKSQRGQTDGGKSTFLPIATMKKREEKQSFPKAHFSNTVEEVLEKFKQFQKSRLNTTLRLIDSIAPSTWEAAEQFNIFPMLGRALVKAGRTNAINGLSLLGETSDLHDDLRNHAKQLHFPSIFAVTTSEYTCFEKMVTAYFKQEYIDKKRGMEHVIEKLNDPINYMSPAILAVIEMGTVGISIYDIDTVAYLSIPKNPGDVVASQVQTMGRGNRFPFKGMRSHDQMRQQINSLAISLEQKYALAQYVAHKCETHIFAVRTTLMDIAYTEYAEDTKTPAEGLQYYMSFMTDKSPAYVKQTAKPKMSLGYDASALNRLYKKHHCECCKVIDEKGTTTCERDARANLESIEGEMTDERWDDVWFNVLHLHHKDVDHFNYNPDNLITACPNLHMGITIFEGHATKRYNKD